MDKTIISVVGPTAIGKTKMAIELAKKFDTEIISADSRQFFKEMSIGTAVPTKEELESAPHHFIQHKSIFESYSVGEFERDALELSKNLFKKKDVLILVGGSGLYVDAFTKGLDNFPKVDPNIRITLNNKYSSAGIESLQTELQSLDPYYYKKVDINNPHRLIRALEVCIGSGQPYSSFLNAEKDQRPFKVLTLGITADRHIIYSRIDKRVDIMIENGLLEEARTLWPHKELNALQTVGYKELFQYFDGAWNLDFRFQKSKKHQRSRNAN